MLIPPGGGAREGGDVKENKYRYEERNKNPTQ